jgi:hypothetical protein
MMANDDRDRERRESGEPGGGQGRRDKLGDSKVFNQRDENIPDDAEVRPAGSWGGGPYDESGGSELTMRDGELLGGDDDEDADGRPR